MHRGFIRSGEPSGEIISCRGCSRRNQGGRHAVTSRREIYAGRKTKQKETKQKKNKKKDESFKIGFIFSFLLQYFNVNIPVESELIIKFAFSIFIICLVCFSCVLNILFYFLGNFIIDKTNLLNKWPKLKFFINIYKKTNFMFIFIEGIMCLCFLLFLILISI